MNNFIACYFSHLVEIVRLMRGLVTWVRGGSGSLCIAWILCGLLFVIVQFIMQLCVYLMFSLLYRFLLVRCYLCEGGGGVMV